MGKLFFGIWPTYVQLLITNTQAQQHFVTVTKSNKTKSFILCLLKRALTVYRFMTVGCNIILSRANNIFLTNIHGMIKEKNVDILYRVPIWIQQSSQPILDCDKKRFNVQTLSGTSLSLLKQAKSILGSNIWTTVFVNHLYQVIKCFMFLQVTFCVYFELLRLFCMQLKHKLPYVW